MYKKFGLNFHLYVDHKKHITKEGYIQSDFPKRISMRKRADLLQFCDLIKPYIKHANRLRQLEKVRIFILQNTSVSDE